jgi:hypothetical protein
MQSGASPRETPVPYGRLAERAGRVLRLNDMGGLDPRRSRLYPHHAGEPERAARLRRASLDQLAHGDFAEYFEPFSGEPLGSSEQSWTAAVALDWLANDPDEKRERRRGKRRKKRVLSLLSTPE